MKPRVRKVLRRVFVEDLGLKLLSLVAAVTLFFVVHGSEESQKTVYVDVISTLPDSSHGRMLISELPVRVRVTLTGTPSQLNSIRQGDVPPIELDLRDVTLTSYEFDLMAFDLPVGVTATAVDPEMIPLEWVQRRERRVRVRPLLVGALRPGRMLHESVRVEPETVTVVGPREEIEGISYLETAEIELSGLSDGPTQRRVRLLRLPEHVMVEGDSSVTVSLEVVPERAERTLARVPVGAVGLAARAIRPAQVSVTLFGPPAVVQGIDPDSVLPFVDASDLRATHAPEMLPVQIGGLPPDVEVRRVQPPSVLFTPAN